MVGSVAGRLKTEKALYIRELQRCPTDPADPVILFGFLFFFIFKFETIKGQPGQNRSLFMFSFFEYNYSVV